MTIKKALVIRLGAIGDNIIITPVLSRLKELGYYVILNTNERGIALLKDDKRIDEFIKHDETMSYDDLHDHWDKLKDDIKPDFFVNFTGSIENNLALHPIQPDYTLPKYERALKCNKNYYIETAKWAKLEGCATRPSLFFTKEVEDYAQSVIKKGKFNILWALSGSGRNKVYPWTEFVMGSVIKQFHDVHFITVGDTKCKILENIHHQLPTENFTELAGEIPIIKSMALTKYVDLVVSPDTGILHAAGCWKTPKIGLLGHTTKKNITETFENDYSIEAKCACAPCYYLIYDHLIQCPVDLVTKAAWCMSCGIQPEDVYEKISLVIKKHGKQRSISS